MKRPRFSLLALFGLMTICSMCCAAIKTDAIMFDRLFAERGFKLRCAALSAGVVDRDKDGRGWIAGCWWRNDPRVDGGKEHVLVEVTLTSRETVREQP